MGRPIVCMSVSAAAAASAEFARWAALGRACSGAAWEAVVYPLVGVIARRGHGRSPLEATALEDCAALVVPAVVVPPPALAHYGPTWARPAAGAATTGAAGALQAQIDGLRAAHPRLDCYGRMHSHPWPHRAPHPSGTDCAEHLTGALAANRAAGLPWSLGLIAAAPECGVRSAECGIDHERRVRDSAFGIPHSALVWPVRAYGLEAGGRLVDLGPVRVVADGDPRMRWARAGAGWATAAGRRWLAGQQTALAGRGWAVTGLPLHRGWYGLAVRGPGDAARLIALPPGFPVTPWRVLRRAADGAWQVAGLGRGGRGWGDHDLLDALGEGLA